MFPWSDRRHSTCSFAAHCLIVSGSNQLGKVEAQKCNTVSQLLPNGSVLSGTGGGDLEMIFVGFADFSIDDRCLMLWCKYP